MSDGKVVRRWKSLKGGSTAVDSLNADASQETILQMTTPQLAIEGVTYLNHLPCMDDNGRFCPFVRHFEHVQGHA